MRDLTYDSRFEMLILKCCARMVLEFRRWLDSRGGGGPTPGDPGPILDDRQKLLDRWEQHTKHCPSCLQVLRMCQAFLAVQCKASQCRSSQAAKSLPYEACTETSSENPPGVSALCSWRMQFPCEESRDTPD